MHPRPARSLGNWSDARWPTRHSRSLELKRGEANTADVAASMANAARSTTGQRRRATRAMTAPRRSERSNSRRARSASASSSRERDASSTRAEGSDDGGAVVAGDAEAEEDTTTSARRGERSDTPLGRRDASGGCPPSAGEEARRVLSDDERANTTPRGRERGRARAHATRAETPPTHVHVLISSPRARTCAPPRDLPGTLDEFARLGDRQKTGGVPGSRAYYCWHACLQNLSLTSVVQGQLPPYSPPIHNPRRR